MRKYVLLMILFIVMVLCVGIATSKGGDDYQELEVKIKEIFMLNHINTVCDTKLLPHDVLYVGDHDGKSYFYTPLNAECQFTGEYTNVWFTYTADMN